MLRKCCAAPTLACFCIVPLERPLVPSSRPIERELDRAGFHRVFRKNFAGFTLKGKFPPAVDGLSDNEVPLYNRSAKSGSAAAADFLYLPPDQQPLDLQFAQALDDWTPPIPTQRRKVPSP